jgi:hypothetical protein
VAAKALQKGGSGEGEGEEEEEGEEKDDEDEEVCLLRVCLFTFL